MTSGSTFADSSAPSQVPPPRIIVIYPNCSLTPRIAALFLLATGGAPFLIAGFLASKGLWPVLPFAGIEVGLLIWATVHSMRRGEDRETLEIADRTVTIERLEGADRHITVFPRHWTKVKLRAPQLGLHPSRLWLEAQGRTCEVGRCLSEDERRGLAARLKQLIGNANDAPVLRVGLGR